MATDDEPGPTVQQGSRVCIQDGSHERTLLIRRDEPELWAADSISADTPLARALLGHAVGDEVEVQAHPVVPVRRVTILAIE